MWVSHKDTLIIQDVFYYYFFSFINLSLSKTIFSPGDMWDALHRLPIKNRLINTLLNSHEARWPNIRVSLGSWNERSTARTGLIWIFLQFLFYILNNPRSWFDASNVFLYGRLCKSDSCIFYTYNLWKYHVW